MKSNPTYVVYGLIGFDGATIYVGATMNIDQRVRQHRRKSWFLEVAEVRFMLCETREEMLEREAERIRELNPRHNINGGGTGLRADTVRRPGRTMEELLADPDFHLKAAAVATMFTDVPQ